METGCLVSEYPPGIPARPDYFPRRNRILSGLSQATLVVEAGEGSGALHTANHAFEQGRDVFAVPGSVFSRQSAGTNQLIRESTAKLVATPEQLLEELNLAGAGGQLALAARPRQRAVSEQPVRDVTTTAEEGQILHHLQGAVLHVDEIARVAAMPVAAVTSTLTILELRGLVRQERPLVYSRA
jgi:DNA processing protein